MKSRAQEANLPKRARSTSSRGRRTRTSYNPSADGHPAKLWELLRRNPMFAEKANGIVALARSSQSARRLQAEQLITDVYRPNPCAATALRWLWPEPTFIFTYPRRVDGTDLDGHPTKFDLQWEGFEPDPPPLTDPAWRVMDDRPDCRGFPSHVGPTIRQNDGYPVDYFRQWREDAKNLPPFSLECAWPQTPQLFRWAFAYHWRHIEHGINPHTGQPDALLSLHETNLFQGWRLAEFDPSTVAGLARQLEFARLSEYRLFAFPKVRYATAREIDDLLKQLGDRLKAEMVCKDEIFGTETQWKVFLCVEAERADCSKQGLSFSLEDAITSAGRDLYGAKYDPQHRKDIVLGYYKAMDSHGTAPGWLQKIFPTLPPEILSPGPPSET